MAYIWNPSSRSYYANFYLPQNLGAYDDDDDDGTGDFDDSYVAAGDASQDLANKLANFSILGQHPISQSTANDIVSSAMAAVKTTVLPIVAGGAIASIIIGQVLTNRKGKKKGKGSR